MVFPEVLEGRPRQHPVVMDIPDLHPIFSDTTLAGMVEGPCHSQARAESKAPHSAFADGSGDLAVVLSVVFDWDKAILSKRFQS